MLPAFARQFQSRVFCECQSHRACREFLPFSFRAGPVEQFAFPRPMQKPVPVFGAAGEVGFASPRIFFPSCSGAARAVVAWGAILFSNSRTFTLGLIRLRSGPRHGHAPSLLGGTPAIGFDKSIGDELMRAVISPRPRSTCSSFRRSICSSAAATSRPATPERQPTPSRHKL